MANKPLGSLAVVERKIVTYFNQINKVTENKRVYSETGVFSIPTMRGQYAGVKNNGGSPPKCVLKVDRAFKIVEVIHQSSHVRMNLQNSLIHRYFSEENFASLNEVLSSAFQDSKSSNIMISSDMFGGARQCDLLVLPQVFHRRVHRTMLIFSALAPTPAPASKSLTQNSGWKEKYEELEKAQAALRNELVTEKKASEVQSMFVSIASHQFRTPLTVIMSNAGLLRMLLGRKDSLDGQSSLRRIIHRIEAEVKRMTFTMDDVLLLGKIRAGSIKPKRRPLDLVPFCRRVVENHNDIQKDGRAIHMEVVGEPQLLKLDAKLMEDVLSNLISNAFKYSLGQPAPLLTLTYHPDQVSICVKDFGIGIPKEDLNRIFEPFYRATNASDISGTGLGTAIALEFIKLNGGELHIQSEVEVGSEFNIIFHK